MNVYDWIIFFIIAILLMSTGINVFWKWEWKRRHDEAVELWSKESESKNNIITSLRETIETLKARDKVIKIEKFYSKPTEISSKITVHKDCDFIDEKTFKEIIVYELSKDLAEKISLDPYFYKVLFSFDPMMRCETVEIRTRFLPYMEAAEWKSLKEES